MKITKIEKTKRGNVAVYADNEYVMAVNPNAYIDSGIHLGDEIGLEELKELLSLSQYEKAKKKALNMLSRQAYTKKQLTERVARTLDTESAEKAVNRMQELGLIDDEDYAKRYALELFENKHYAIKRISYELYKKGLSKENIEIAIDSLGDFDDLKRAVNILEKKYGKLKDDADIRRASGMLDRYGYSYDVIRDAIHALREFEYGD